MKAFIFLVGLLIVLCGCTTLSPQTKELLVQKHKPTKHILNDVPFHPQASGDCGPTALAMAMTWAGTPASLETLRLKVLTPEKEGTLPADMIVASRSYGLLAVEIHELKNIVRELSRGQPVIVLLNLGFSWMPSWHYAVVTGYDLERQVLVLHSGDSRHMEMPLTYFERHWELAKHWSIVILPPDKIAVSAGELKNMKAAAGIEASGHLEAAKTAYETILAQWPRSLSAHIGLSNIAYKNNDLKEAINVLKAAHDLHPSSSIVKNNLEILRGKTVKNSFRPE